MISVLFLLLSSKILVTKGQGTCSNACPPLNAGKEVQAVCPGDTLPSSFVDTTKPYTVCHPRKQTINLNNFKQKGHVTIVANYYVGCEAGLRESGLYAHIAQRYFNKYGNRTTFIQSVKGGGTCDQWADIYIPDALSFNASIVPKDMPLTINDVNYEIRDDLFTEPFKHPSYIILDENLTVREKFIGPCCGYSTYASCNASVVSGLDRTLSGFIDEILQETGVMENVFDSKTIVEEEEEECVVGNWSEWSPCPITCGVSSFDNRFRYRTIEGNCTNTNIPIETKPCIIIRKCEEIQCMKEFGMNYTIETVHDGFNKPKDVKFHPTPGYHLRNYSEGREFHAGSEEAWVVNSGNHSVSVISALNTPYQSSISRRDRGYYHYMINGTAISFNTVKDSNRTEDRDSLNYWAICNDNNNTYLGTKEANYFMGPTLYNSSPKNFNLVNKLGEECQPNEECYFLHSDMLHESPSCIGIVHDTEVTTAYGNVYWVFDTVGNRENGQLVRFDFQQPHGPGSMDHSVAAVRRYVEVKLNGNNVHAGMAIHPQRRELYISNPGDNNILAVKIDTGTFSRFARQEYPIYSNRLPSFEYSIWECVDKYVFAEGIQTPSGIAISDTHLFVAEYDTSKIKVYEIETGVEMYSIDTGFNSIGGMAFSPVENILYFVDEETDTLNRVRPTVECNDVVPSRSNPEYTQLLNRARNNDISLTYNYTCTANPIIPDSSYFEQVHDDTGYADADPNVQSPQAAMDASAALLANRTDCGYDSDLNFDALLLGGYYCHVCLPHQDMCEDGGKCSNVQWRGYTCDNEFKIKFEGDNVLLQMSNGTNVDWNMLQVKEGVTYRFTVDGNEEVCLTINNNEQSCATNGPILQPITQDITKITFTSRSKIIYELIIKDVMDEIVEEEIIEKNSTSFIDTILDSPITKTIAETYSSTNLTPAATVGITIGILVFVLLIPVSFYFLPIVFESCKKDKGKKETAPPSTTNKIPSERISSKEIAVEDGEKKNLTLSVALEGYC